MILYSILVDTRGAGFPSPKSPYTQSIAEMARHIKDILLISFTEFQGTRIHTIQHMNKRRNRVFRDCDRLIAQIGSFRLVPESSPYPVI